MINPQEGQVQRYEAGSQLVREGEKSRKMFIILNGKARVYKTYLNRRVTLAVLGKGEVFGEMSFFDAEPRSASVDALTEIETLILDGEKAEREIAHLPTWIFPILRSTFERFREADRKITVLQSMNEFRKTAFKTDQLAKTIYHELLRFIKALRVLYKNGAGAGGAASSAQLYRELDEVLGERKIGLRIFWRQLKENEIIDNPLDEKSGVCLLDERTLAALEEYLLYQSENEIFLLLSHTAVAVLRRIVGFAEGDAKGEFSLADLKLSAIPFLQESLSELERHGLLKTSGGGIEADPGQIQKHYVYQNILKAFDHTAMNVD